MGEAKRRKQQDLNYGKNEMYFYYLPCLNSQMEVVGGIFGNEEPVQKGDIFIYWNCPVEAIEVPLCQPSHKPNLNALPYLKIKKVDMNTRTVPARIFTA